MKKFTFLSLLLISLTFVPHSHRVRASFVDGALMAEKLLELTNNERTKVALPTLALNPELSQAAQAKAEDMLKEGYFSHTSPGGKVFYHWVDSTGYEYSAVGENLALNLNTVSAEQMVESWLNSPGHRVNLLSSTYTETGMGVSSGIYQGSPAVFAVQVFATPKNKVANKIAVPIAVPAKVAVSPKKSETPASSPSLNTVESAPKTVVLGNEFQNKIDTTDISSAVVPDSFLEKLLLYFHNVMQGF